MTEQYTREVKHYAFGPLVTVQTIHPDLLKTMKQLARVAKREKHRHNKYLAGLIAEEYRFKLEDNKKVAAMFGPHIDEYIKQGMTYSGGDYRQLLEDGAAVLQGTWVNYMKAGEFNPPHTHGGLISMILYLDVPELIDQSAKEVEGNTLPGAVSFRWGENQPLSINLAAAAPKTGELYIFPAHVEHQVTPFYVDCTRISVSSNWEIGDKKHGDGIVVTTDEGEK